MSRFWVAGASGFLGAELARQLSAAGHELVLVSRRGGAAYGHAVSALDVTDSEAVSKSAAGCDGAFLAVGYVSRDPSDGELIHRTHVLATERALEGLRRAGVRRVVCVSTSGTIACGRDPRHVYTEDSATPHELISRWPYYRAKYFAERAALERNAEREFEVVVVNPSLLLGPGDRRQSSTLEVRRFLAGSIPAIPAGGLAFVDVRDAAAATIAAFERGRAGERYLVSASNMPFATFFGRLSRLTGKSAPWLRLPKNRELALASHWAFEKALGFLGGSTPLSGESVDMGSHYWYCDSSKARRELGFAPRDGQETLRDTVRDILAEG